MGNSDILTSAPDGGELVTDFLNYINISLLHSTYFVCETKFREEQGVSRCECTWYDRNLRLRSQRCRLRLMT